MVATNQSGALIFIFFVLKLSQGTYLLQIEAISYSTTNSCCDPFCGECDNQFDFCLRNQGTSQDGNTGNCPLGSYTSGEVDGSSITFGSSIAGVENPLSFTGNVWPGEVQLFIRVTDLDLQFHDHVDDIYTAIRTSPSSAYSFHQAITGNNGVSTITLRYRVSCLANYYGSDCATYCVGRDNSSGHYTCGTNGEVVCRSGWTENATNCVTPICASECNITGGYCVIPGECRCRSGWTGVNCDECVPASGCSNVGGYCTVPDQCICKTGYLGTNCDIDVLPCERSSPCLNGAACINNGTGGYSCVCSPLYTGDECGQDINECEPNPCLNQGTCQITLDGYICSCLPNTTGNNCIDEVDAVPNDANSGLEVGTKGAIIGGAVGGAVVVVILILVIIGLFIFSLRKRKEKLSKLKHMHEEDVKNPAYVSSMEWNGNVDKCSTMAIPYEQKDNVYEKIN